MMSSFRLRTLHSYFNQEENIWDIGCDHGLLGLSFSEHQNVKSIHLVDPSAPVIDKLHKTIKDSYISEQNLFVHHQDGQSLLIDSKSNCIFIAGMGGKEIGEIILKLLPQLDETSKIVISPHRKILELRKLLNELPIALIREEVIFEDGQYYQILCLGPNVLGPRVSLYGEELWKSDTGRRYLDHQAKHFESHADQSSRLYVSFLRALFS